MLLTTFALALLLIFNASAFCCPRWIPHYCPSCPDDDYPIVVNFNNKPKNPRSKCIIDCGDDYMCIGECKEKYDSKPDRRYVMPVYYNGKWYYFDRSFTRRWWGYDFKPGTFFPEK